MYTYKQQVPKIRLVREQSVYPIVKIQTSKDASRYIREFYEEDIDICESFYVIFLNQAHHTIGWAKLSQGGITSTVVDIRILAKMAVESLACRVVLAHNHPSGNLQPSEADRKLTTRAKECLLLFDIHVIDHVILGPDGSYYSFADEGLL